MTSFNISSSNFSNSSSSLQKTDCNILDNSLPAQIGKLLSLTIVLWSSLVGNILIIIIVHKRVELRNTINYFMVNMAVSDFVYPLTILPINLTEIASSSRQWNVAGTAGLIFCKIKSYLRHVSFNVSVQCVIWIGLDRFVAVIFPMKAHLISSRVRAIAIASTWIVAMAVNSVDLYTFGLAEINKETVCIYLNNNTAFSLMYKGKGHIYVFHIVPLTIMAILYCALAATLRRQDNALRRATVHQKDERKRRAIKMSLCVMAAFFICTIPITLENILDEYEIPLSCTFYKAFSFFSHFMFFLSSTSNPIICFLFVESYRRGLKEIFNSCGRKPTTTEKRETDGQDGITLQRITINIPEVNENLAFCES